MRTAPAALGAVALATAPVITTILSVLFRQETFTWRLLLGSLIAFSGVAMGVLSAGERSKGTMAGVLLVLASAFVWAVSVVMYRKLVTDLTPVRVLTLSFPGAFLMMVPYGLGPLTHTDWSAVTTQGWLAVAYLVVVAGVAAFAAYYKGLADVGPSRTSMTQYFTPPMAAIFAALIIHERLRTLEIVGLLVVIVGVAVAVWRSGASTSSETYRHRPEQGTPQNSAASSPQEG